MVIVIRESNIQFKNPEIGKPTRAVPEHYFGRSVKADVDGVERMFRLSKNELPFESTTEDIERVIKEKQKKEE